MRLINTLLLVIAFSPLNAQQICSTDDFLSIYFLDKISSVEYKEHIDLSSLFLTKETYAGTAEYLGLIGNKKKLLDVVFFSIKKNNNGNYDVKGQTSVFDGATRKFEGEFILKSQCAFDNEDLKKEASYEHEVNSSEIHGFSELEFKLMENNELNSTGIFTGSIFVLWYKNKEGILLYNDIQGYIPNYANCIFNGNWVSYKTKKKSTVAWSHYRIPCSGDLDIGASEFSPNPKYYNVGWEKYKLD